MTLHLAGLGAAAPTCVPEDVRAEARRICGSLRGIGALSSPWDQWSPCFLGGLPICPPLKYVNIRQRQDQAPPPQDQPPPDQAPPPEDKSAFYVGGILALLVAVGGGYGLYRYYKKKKGGR